MTRIALLSSEAIRPRMAGIGIRYLELARRLPRPGLEVVLVTPGDPDEVPDEGRASEDRAGEDRASEDRAGEDRAAEVRRFERGRLREILADCDAAVCQGQLANDLLLEVPELPAAIDLYDPFLVENLHYTGTLGLDPYRNDHATWVLQMSGGDFFLCSCEEQRQFYLGFLAALGRLNPERVGRDPDLDGLIAIVPFGIDARLPEHRPLLPERRPGEQRLLFGGLYDWYDPWPVLEALEIAGEPGWTLYFIKNPNPQGTPQALFAEVEDWCRRRGWWDGRVRALDWIPSARRYDLLRDVDLLVSTHTPSLETRLSLRTRFLDALAADCPVVISEGGAMSRLLRDHDAGWVVPPRDPAAVAAALGEIFAGGEPVASRCRGGAELLRGFAWETVLEPLLRFCEKPEADPTKAAFAFRPPTVAPPDRLGFRARRWLRRKLKGGTP